MGHPAAQKRISPLLFAPVEMAGLLEAHYPKRRALLGCPLYESGFSTRKVAYPAGISGHERL